MSSDEVSYKRELVRTNVLTVTNAPAHADPRLHCAVPRRALQVVPVLSLLATAAYGLAPPEWPRRIALRLTPAGHQ